MGYGCSQTIWYRGATLSEQMLLWSGEVCVCVCVRACVVCGVMSCGCHKMCSCGIFVCLFRLLQALTKSIV